MWWVTVLAKRGHESSKFLGMKGICERSRIDVRVFEGGDDENGVDQGGDKLCGDKVCTVQTQPRDKAEEIDHCHIRTFLAQNNACHNTISNSSFSSTNISWKLSIMVSNSF